MKLLLFTILLISSTNLRLKKSQNNLLAMLQYLYDCCFYSQPNTIITVPGPYGPFHCDPSQFVGMPCFCDNNCIYGKCNNSRCIDKKENDTCYSHMECSPYQSLFCISFMCTNMKGM